MNILMMVIKKNTWGKNIRNNYAILLHVNFIKLQPMKSRMLIAEGQRYLVVQWFTFPTKKYSIFFSRSFGTIRIVCKGFLKFQGLWCNFDKFFSDGRWNVFLRSNLSSCEEWRLNELVEGRQKLTLN